MVHYITSSNAGNYIPPIPEYTKRIAEARKSKLRKFVEKKFKALRSKAGSYRAEDLHGSSTTILHPSQIPFYKRWGPANKLAFGSIVASYECQSQGNVPPGTIQTREGSLTVEFKQGWRDESCQVERWYRNQLKHAANQNSTTSFTKIQHFSTIDKPFFHEFLIIILDGGSAYRVERAGTGFDVDALKVRGCAARDLVQWFPTVELARAARPKPSRMIAEVEFPQKFDIIDILAVCYSVQQNEWASHYTLQCYNCYFLCCAILSVLVRRVAKWERVISLDRWAEIYDQAFTQISTLSSSPLKAEAGKYLVLRACSMLDPNHSQPARFVLDWLHGRLSKEKILRQLLGETMWWSNYGPLVYAWCRESRLDPHEDNSKWPIDRNDWQLFRHGLSTWTRFLYTQPPGETEQLIHKIHDEELLKGSSTHTREANKELHLLYRRKQHVSIPRRALGRICAPISAVIEGLAEYIETKDMYKHVPRVTVAGVIIKSILTSIPNAHLRFIKPDSDGFVFLHETRGEYPYPRGDTADFGAAILERLESIGMTEPDIVLEACEQILHKTVAGWEHFKSSLLILLSETLSELLRNEFSSGPQIVVGKPDLDGAIKYEGLSVFQFQDYIRSHVVNYGERVQRHRLDASELVRRDTEEAIFDIWRTMPSGFGSEISIDAKWLPWWTPTRDRR